MVDFSTVAHSGSTASAAGRQISSRQYDVILNASQRLTSILLKNGQALRVSVGEWSMVFGDNSRSSGDLPELIFREYRSCLRAIRSCSLYYFSRLFLSEKVRIAGPLSALIDVMYSINVENDKSQSVAEKISFFLFRRFKEAIPAFARKFESDFHYSLDARAYALFLDRHLQYTCGRVGPTTRSIDEAQLEKFKLINTWVSERIGTLTDKRHLDIGCGWGGLISYFQQDYGTISTGITNSIAQKHYISSRFGLEAIFGDFRAIDEIKEQFDFVTVIGMSEHVVGGLKDTLLKSIRGCLKDDGVVYFQTIVKPDQWIGGDASRLVREFVFPGHDLDTQTETERRFSKAGFRIVRAENHATDYAYTTGKWAENVSRNLPQLKALIGARTANLFLLYLLYASKLFAHGRGKLMRYCLVKQTDSLLHS